MRVGKRALSHKADRKQIHIVFDFDGTLADSLAMTIAVYRGLTGDKREWSEEEIQAMRKMTLYQLASVLSVSWWRMPFLLRRGRKVMHGRIDELKAFPELPAMIKQLHDRGYDMHIVTSNSTENVQRFLENNHMQTYFDNIHGSIGLFSKARVLKKLKKQMVGKASDSMYYVGDEARDIVASKKAGIQIISVTWGYNHVDLLTRLKPDLFAHAPEDLLEIFP